MDKKLPKVFAVPIEHEMNNNSDMYKSSMRSIENDSFDKKDIIKIFNSKNHVYKTKVIIETIKETYECDVVGLKENHIITLDGKLINIDDIISIKKM